MPLSLTTLIIMTHNLKTLFSIMALGIVAGIS
jgi:hypothetical protein